METGFNSGTPILGPYFEMILTSTFNLDRKQLKKDILRK